MVNDEILKILAKKCSELYSKEKETFIHELTKWFDFVFINQNIPWRCVDKHKYCPIYADFGFFAKCNLRWGWNFNWPETLSQDSIISILEDLGFYTITNSYGNICISVPTPIKSEKTLTWAQIMVKKVNLNYQKYLAEQRNLALIHKSAFINELTLAPIIKIGPNDAIFAKFNFFESSTNQLWYKFMLKSLKKNRIEKYYNEKNEHVGYIFSFK